MHQKTDSNSKYERTDQSYFKTNIKWATILKINQRWITFPIYWFYTEMVDSHVCILQESFDPLLGAIVWALPLKELCLCQGVVAPQTSTSRSCTRQINTDTLEDLWFTGDPSLITLLSNRRNWAPAVLDKLLGRSYCCKFLFMFL